ncbi:4-demethylwyosine synthase TYW1 [Candidatus Woesearchaeota archaeon]|nr:4-demethylwyosine synthase TYW1 [Candidatus Woesearchaeota archaeon]
MLTPEARAELEKQQYRVVGEHSAVKVCHWTKSMMKSEGGCYKLTFYGIQSYQCMQMTTSMSCANRCQFCWRGYKAPVSKEWKWTVDDPLMVLEASLSAHHDLLAGFKGNKQVKPKVYEQSRRIKHVALSLTGEPITYPRINELIRLFHERGISTFLVTNAQYPEQIRDLAPVTQLYVSLDAPTKDLLKTIDVPLFRDYWERLQQSLAYLAQKKQRTTVRLTCIKGMNMDNISEYARLIQKASPDFIELKGYMFVGASRQRLVKENMPYHEEVVDFAKELEKELPGYETVTEHVSSRAVMMAKKQFNINNKWHTWIDFPKFQELALSGKNFTSMDYLKPTPKVGLSGVITKRMFTEIDSSGEMSLGEKGLGGRKILAPIEATTAPQSCQSCPL